MEKEEHKMNDKASYIHREPCKGGAKYFLLLLIIILLSFLLREISPVQRLHAINCYWIPISIRFTL